MITSEDSLVRYSYFLQGYNDSTGSITQGTGFFLNNAGQNEFITAKHVLTGCRFNGSKNANVPDEMLVYFNEDSALNFNFYPLRTKEIKDTSGCLQYYLSPDVISYPLKDTVYKNVSSIDDFLPSRVPNKKGKIIFFGFPSYNNIDSGLYSVKPAVKSEIIKYKLFESFTFNEENGARIIDSINYTIKPADTLIVSRLKGFSGSPVFIEDNENAKWSFLGVIIAIDDKNNLLSIVKPRYFLEKIGYTVN